MRFCCESFSRLADGVPRKGFGVFVDDYDDRAVFYLQFRSLDRETPLPEGPSRDYLIVATETRVIYCPWCGSHLEEFYAAQWRELAHITKDLALDGDHRRR